MARGAGGQDAIHHVHAHERVVNDFLGSAHAHHIARLVGGEMRQRRTQNFFRELARLAHAQAADGVSGEANFDGALGRFPAQLREHAALDDAE